MGWSIRVVVIDPTGGEKTPRVFINPEVFFFSPDTESFEEGCLSVPGIRVMVNRPKVISVRALDEHSTPFELNNVDGLFARVIQHEVDHLNGILFIDRVSAVRRQLIAGKLRKLAKTHQ
jgi:peptide deformylase